jgi:hypothetical protein
MPVWTLTLAPNSFVELRKWHRGSVASEDFSLSV